MRLIDRNFMKVLAVGMERQEKVGELQRVVSEEVMVGRRGCRASGLWK